MFKIESYVTPILLSYVDKYVRDFKPADAQVSLWGGGVALHNLVLKPDVLQQEVSLPFTLVSGRIHELLIQVPWTKIMSEPIVVTIDTIECVLSLNRPASPEGAPPPEPPSRKTQVVEAPPGYMQALVRRIVSNIALRVHHLIVKYVQDDIVMSLNVKHLAVDSAGANWEPAFADIEQNHPVIRRLVRLDDLTLCLDKTDADGKIRFYQEPLLYRCQLELRVSTRLVSANTRRATSLNVQLRSTKLAWSVTSDQLTLLLRLVRERAHESPHKTQPAAPKQTASQPPLQSVSTANSAEPARSGGWSDWAWSWLPSWSDREGGVEDVPAPATPLPLHFSAYLDDVSLVFKIMEVEGTNRKRARGVLELAATHAAVKSYACLPTTMRVRLGARDVSLKSHGKCVCGFSNYESAHDLPTVYLSRIEEQSSEPWTWPVERSVSSQNIADKIETAQAVDETYRASPEGVPEGGTEASDPRRADSYQAVNEDEVIEQTDELWVQMNPLLYVEFSHERSPPDAFTNPYESPPKDFQYSDWVEECTAKIKLEPLELRVSTDLIHRLTALKMIYKELQPPADVVEPKQSMRTLTVEECESLVDNLPERRVLVQVSGLRVRMLPWHHSAAERPAALVLDLDLPKTHVSINGPLYPHRVCSAACQMPDDVSTLFLNSRLNVSATITGVNVTIASMDNSQRRPCARADIRFVMHTLLNKSYFTRTDFVENSYLLKIKLNICGSSARLQAAWQVPLSLIKGKASVAFKQSSLATDALNDEDAVAVDFTLEELLVRGYVTSNIQTHVISLQSAKATALHETKNGEVKQAWLFSAPDTPTTTPYCRVLSQWCTVPVANSFDYLGAWCEPTAISIDPLFIAWLAYKPYTRPVEPSMSSLNISSRNLASSSYFLRRRSTPPSSSGRFPNRSSTGAELVHFRPRSRASSSEPSEQKSNKQANPPPPKEEEPWWYGERLLALHNRMKSMLINIELGLTLMYVTMSTASALDCVTLRDAMERHAAEIGTVLVFSLGRLAMHSNTANMSLWSDLRHDGPTFIKQKLEAESFPWKLRLADVSCYTLERSEQSAKLPREHSSTSPRSTLKSKTSGPAPRTVLELVTTTVTVSVVTKAVQIKTVHTPAPTKKDPDQSPKETRTKFFTAGMEFKPTTLKEFVRGPSRRTTRESRSAVDAGESEQVPKIPKEDVTIKTGPVVSLGVHLHADTPPIIVRLEREQLHVMASAFHCLNHIITLLKREQFVTPKQALATSSSQRSLIRSVSELEEVQTPSEDISSKSSELIEIFDRSAQDVVQRKLTTFFWFQWVVSRATLVVASRFMKLAIDIDDVISTVDIQTHYNQLKVKLAAASVRHYERAGSDEWTASALGGRVLEAREPTSVKDENNFLAVTITQAQISNLPASWKEELHPKLLEHKNGDDTMWEIYATLAPLEVIIQPVIVDNVTSLIREMAPKAFCPLKSEVDNRVSTWQWPFCYLTAGGVRVLITGEEPDKNPNVDDTFMFNIGRVTLNPHPDNPICRRAVNANADNGWAGSANSYDGRQYELSIHNVTLMSSQFKQLISQASEELQKTTIENPALKWSQQIQQPMLTPILHSVHIGCVLAPALYMGGVLSCGPALEVNLVSDCAIELSVSQLALWNRILTDMALRDRERDSSLTDLDKYDCCPYADLIKMHEPEHFDLAYSDAAIAEVSDFGRSLAEDSGVETMASQSTSKARMSEDTPLKKTVSIVLNEQLGDSMEYMEVFFTMGTIEISLYSGDDGTPEVIALRPPVKERIIIPSKEPATTDVKESDVQPLKREKRMINYRTSRKDDSSSPDSRSVTDVTREADIKQPNLDIPHFTELARNSEGNVPLIHVTLQQPNLYYWRKKGQKSLQVSLFNAWVGLGIGQVAGHWHLPILCTKKGLPDPVTDIPPALATMKLVAPVSAPGVFVPTMSSSAARGSIKLDIERPINIEICTDRLRRLKGIVALIQQSLRDEDEDDIDNLPSDDYSALYKLRRRFLQENIESITIQTSQIGVHGAEGAAGWDSACMQIAASSRPERVIARTLLTALSASAGPPQDRRHIIMQPVMMGMEMEATWEAWRRAEGGPGARDPTVTIGVEVDRVTIDLRPCELATINRLHQAVKLLLGRTHEPPPAPANSQFSLFKQSGAWPQSSLQDLNQRLSSMSADSDAHKHYYTDDLRSGAFKILTGSQLPMAYQVMLHRNAVSWRYPHPRAITRVVAFPLPGADQEVDCVLELYSQMLDAWEPHTYFKIPIGEPRELKLFVPPPDAVFAVMWRFRALSNKEPNLLPYEFNHLKFLPRNEPLLTDHNAHKDFTPRSYPATAEQLSGVLRVDSYFAPRLLPRTKLIVRVQETELHLYNSLPFLSSQATALEGYYVSRPLMRSHRVLSVIARNSKLHAQLGSPSGVLTIVDTALSSDIMDCATGTMEQLVDEFRVQAGVSCATEQPARARVATTGVRVALHVPRMRTLHALLNDWNTVVDEYIQDSSSIISREEPAEKLLTKLEVAAATAEALEGRVSLWIHNSCASALRVGQEGTDELVPLGPGARLAYRWRSPSAPKRLRLALANPTAWHWSQSIPFTAGSCRVKLEDPTESDKKGGQGTVSVHVKVEENGARRYMHLSGRLALANMLRFNLLYKVRARNRESSQWQTVCSGEVMSETVGRSVVCSSDAEMVLKIKFVSHETGWSGDIPLKECPKENVPWLVKVPSEGDITYVSVWCRVVRARSDGRILATVWPLYVLHSHLPLDTDVLIVTEKSMRGPDTEAEPPPAPLIQSTPGRGGSTHLLAPGTTANRHTLSFQYRNIECPVTREAVPLHYGVTDTSVFDKRTPVTHIDEVVQEILQWLERSGRHAKSTWPYSLVAKHWNGPWQSALLQPRSDVTVRYQAVRAGGGCSLEIQLCPVVLLCNAAPITLTLRAHDAAPLCKLESGSAISPPSAILTKPFFISVEVGRETFVSSQLCVSAEEPGRYGAPPPGHVALEHAARFSIQCNQKVALLTMYYEIKEQINVLGITSTYMLINRLNRDVLVSAIAEPADDEDNQHKPLRVTTFKVVRPTKDGSIHGTPLCRFWLRHRWRGGDPSELRTFLCAALPSSSYPARAPVPIVLGGPPVRRGIALIDENQNSVPVLVSQVRHDSRWLVVLSHDPCPQFVVHNFTRMPLCIAQPAYDSHEPSTSYVQVSPECHGTRWYCTVQPRSAVHYSTPAYCERYPPPAAPPANLSSVTMLTFGRMKDEANVLCEWCAPVAAADGEQLLQFHGGITVKLRVRTHPHSTLLELQDTDHNDISASDIRRRLNDLSEESFKPMKRQSDALELQRTDAISRLLPVNELDQTSLTSKVVEQARSTVIEDPLKSRIIVQETLSTTEEEPTTSKTEDETPVPVPSGTDVEETRPKTDTESFKVLFAETIRDRDMEDSDYHFYDRYPEEGNATSSFDMGSGLTSGMEVSVWSETERVRCVIAGVVVEMAASADVPPLFALHLDRSAIRVNTDNKRLKTTISIADVQIDNLQYDSGQYDFAVVASTRASPLAPDHWPALWNMFVEEHTFSTRQDDARLLLKLTHDSWSDHLNTYKELTEVEIRMGSLALYVEDAYVTALVELSRLAVPSAASADLASILAEERSLRNPLRLRLLHVYPLDLTLTLHTAVRMYIALDQSPLRLSAFKLHDMMTSAERLTHALTVHYLSAAILGAGWVVGGLELLGAPGALAARLGGATGGVKGVASATAAALLRSLSAWAGSLARNLDLLAGDEEHARRAAAARRRPPPSFVAGLVAGITNFAINILGAVGGLAHHPLVGVAVGETESGAAALRRGLLGALTKPLSATADLVAYAGHGLLRQTGWDPVPEPRSKWSTGVSRGSGGWRRDCVRWTFRLAELHALAGFEVLLDNAPLQLLLTHKYLVVAEPESERIVEMIDLRFCTLGPYQGQIIELNVMQRRLSKAPEQRGANDEEDEYQITAAAMARVARYTGAEGTTGPTEERILSLLPAPGRSHSLHAALAAALHHNADTHFSLM
ncbi:vacuolar protein sorting 13B isoform X2 [Anticarsia gemmatalis]|uniref:vacuolar protein sorting 13B isoform X2 n=1 Tax=Anticarsia gemmatalis TaxID=129554 RepID=UPI003F7688E6